MPTRPVASGVCGRCGHEWDIHNPRGCQRGNIQGNMRECNCPYGFPA